MTRSSKAEVEAIVRQLRNGTDPKAQLQAAQTLGTLWLFMECRGGGEGGKTSPLSGSKGPSSFEAVLAAATDLGAWDALVDTLNQVSRIVCWSQRDHSSGFIGYTSHPCSCTIGPHPCSCTIGPRIL